MEVEKRDGKVYLKTFDGTIEYTDAKWQEIQDALQLSTRIADKLDEYNWTFGNTPPELYSVIKIDLYYEDFEKAIIMLLDNGKNPDIIIRIINLFIDSLKTKISNPLKKETKELNLYSIEKLNTILAKVEICSSLLTKYQQRCISIVEKTREVCRKTNTTKEEEIETFKACIRQAATKFVEPDRSFIIDLYEKEIAILNGTFDSIYLGYPKKILHQEIEEFRFTNNFDSVDSKTVYNHFYNGLVKSKMLTKIELDTYLTTAFEKTEVPKVLLSVKSNPSKEKVMKVFYTYYTDIAGKPYRESTKYASLLGNYFRNFKTPTITTNWSKTVY